MGKISMAKGKGSLYHNKREYLKYGAELPNNIDANLMKENVILIDENVKNAYDRIFGEALIEYNSKQKRKDRKINDYYDHIKKSKNKEKTFYEHIIQWGSIEDFKRNPKLRKIAKECLIEYVKGFQERNPNIQLVGAYIHMDEASPHLHLDYIPVAAGYKNGLNKRNSLTKALEQQGFKPNNKTKKENSTKEWIKSERNAFTEICKNHNLDVEKEEHSTRKNLSVEEYKRAKHQQENEINKSLDEYKQQIANLSTELASVSNKTIKAEELHIPEQKTILGKIKQPKIEGILLKNISLNEAEALYTKNNLQNKTNDFLIKTQESVYTQTTIEKTRILDQANKEAQNIISKADENIKIAESIINERDSIINKAKQEAYKIINKAQNYFDELKNNIEKLLKQKSNLEAQISSLSNVKEEYNDLYIKKQKLTRALEKDVKTVRFTKDSKECITIPKNLFYELVNKRDRKQYTSKELDSFINKQKEIDDIINNKKNTKYDDFDLDL